MSMAVVARSIAGGHTCVHTRGQGFSPGSGEGSARAPTARLRGLSLLCLDPRKLPDHLAVSGPAVCPKPVLGAAGTTAWPAPGHAQQQVRSAGLRPCEHAVPQRATGSKPLCTRCALLHFPNAEKGRQDPDDHFNEGSVVLAQTRLRRVVRAVAPPGLVLRPGQAMVVAGARTRTVGHE